MPAVSRIFALVGFVLAPMPSRAFFLSSDCPKVKPVPDLNITEFTRASWYVQEQQVTSYQSEDQLNCVVATYDAGKSGWWEPPLFFDGEVLSVYNSYEGGSPTLNDEGKPTGRLCASVKNEKKPSKLLVAPCFLPIAFGGKYWVIGFGSDSQGQYEWALISGGSPKNKYDDGCTTGTGYFDSGLWIFSRSPILSEAKLAEAKNLLTEKGYTLQLLKKVKQDGCTYQNQYIKP